MTVLGTLPSRVQQQGWAALGTRPGYCGPTLQLQSENGVSMSIKLIKNISGEEEVELNHSLWSLKHEM